ncbi:MAG: rRNA (pseudouridine1915-N3)-methyltransferase, partial [Aliidongia sp.]|nr:rRNA (pseudouridine1915-N3)-methyltransferase [Aliidongia sp.]
MRCHLIAVGRAKPGPARDLFALYAGRLSPPLSLTEIEEKRPLPEALLKEREGELLRAALPKGAFLVLLDEHGKSLSSEGFAEQLGLWRDRSVADLAFAIGGATGHGPTARTQADFTLSLGPMTWPHMMVRGMLAEQLYRGFSILACHPYHRD